MICHTVNLDSPAAKAGLALGDKLVAFEGMPITDANQFTNLISTYPAGWPVELVVEREGARKTIHVAAVRRCPTSRSSSPAASRPRSPKPPKRSPRKSRR